MAELEPQAAEGLHHLAADTMSERYNIRAGFSLQDAVLGNSDPSAVLYGLAADYMRADLPEWVHMETLAAQVAELQDTIGINAGAQTALDEQLEDIGNACENIGALGGDMDSLLSMTSDLADAVSVLRSWFGSDAQSWDSQLDDMKTDADRYGASENRADLLEKEIEDLRETVQALEAELLGAGE